MQSNRISPPRRPAPVVGALFLIVLLASPAVAHATLRVVATTAELAAVARDIGGDAVEVTALSSSRQDPHFVDPRPSFVVALNRADLLIANGVGLEIGWLPALQTQARNPSILNGRPGYLDGSEHVDLVRTTPANADRSRGDVHPGGNPHYMKSPDAAAELAAAIARRMASLDPDNAAHYTASAERFQHEMQEFRAQQRERFAGLGDEQRRVVVYHDSFVYLLNWLGLEAVATVEPLPGVAPSPRHVAGVLDTMRRTGAKVVVQEEYYPSETSETLARLVEGAVVSIPGGPRFEEGESYQDYLRAVTDRLHAAQGGR